MNLNLDNYIKKFDNFLDKDLCKKTIEELKNCNWKQHQFYDPKSKKYISVSKEQELDSTFDLVSTNKIIMDKIWHSLNQYIKELNFSWYRSWSGYSQLKYNRYDDNKKMAEHCDHIHSLFDGEIKGIPILSIVGLLNDDFEGGDFIMFENKKIDFKEGDLIIFPSVFLYPHKVQPIKKGTRYSYVSWVW